MNTPAPKTSPDEALSNLMGTALGTPDTARPISTQMAEPPRYGAPAEVALRIGQYIGRYGREDTATLLLYEAMNALRLPAPAVGAAQTAAARDVLAERQRQRLQEGWADARDDEYDLGELASAAATYARYAALQAATDDPHPLRRPLVDLWPWDAAWWKPGDARRNLEKAGALILAEIERLDRAAIAAQQGKGGEK